MNVKSWIDPPPPLEMRTISLLIKCNGKAHCKMAQNHSCCWSTFDHISGEIDEKCEPIMTLDGGRGWRCLCCGKEFGTRSSCRRHVETLHYATPSQDCQLCGKILKNKNSHQNHMIMVHGHKKRMWWLLLCCSCASHSMNKFEINHHFDRIYIA